MGIIAERWIVDERVHLDVQRLTGPHRAFGAIALGAPPPGGALLLPRCGSVHGCFIRTALDVVFVDRAGVALRVARLDPWRALWRPGAHAAFELAAGEAARLGVRAGMRFKKISF